MKIQLIDYTSLLGPYFRRFNRLFILVTVLLLSGIALQVVNPQFMKYFIDLALAGGALSRITATAGIFLALTLLQQLIAIGARYNGENLAWLATNELRRDLAEHCINLDMSFHNNKLKGELIERIDGDVRLLAVFFSQLIIKVFGNLLLMAGVLLVIFWENWLVGSALTLASSLSIFIINKTKNLAMSDQRKLQQTEAELYGYLEERLSATEDIKAIGALDFIMNGFYTISKRIRKIWWDRNMKIVWINSIGFMAGTLIYIVTYPICFYMFFQEKLTLGAAFVIVYYIGILTGPISDISNQIQELQGVGASIVRIRELLNTETVIKDGVLNIQEKKALAISFDRVFFSYADDKQVLQDISFSIKENNILGVIGRTGSGKTTLARLLFRLYDVDRGSISFDNNDIRTFKINSLRNSVAMVTQDIQLFRATIRENLSFFDPTVSDDRIIAAFRHLHLFDWFQKLPNGLDTMLNSGNTGLSAGEAQLLALTRIFLKDPKLIILDEASSRLDPATENLLDKTIRYLLRDRTAIIIAHRLQTIEKADSILILEEGRIREFGDRVSLADDPQSYFSALLKTGIDEVLA